MNGAIRIKTGIIESPFDALQRESYKCVECNGDVFLRRGEIRRPHFAHKSENNPCKNYERSGKNHESDKHRDAKYLIKNIIETKRSLNLIRKCNNCNLVESYDVPVNDVKNVELEQKVDNGRADILVKFNNNSYIIIEIVNTHYTEYRTGVWFELYADMVINEYRPTGNIVYRCNRNFRCNDCETKIRFKAKIDRILYIQRCKIAQIERELQEQKERKQREEQEERNRKQREEQTKIYIETLQKEQEERKRKQKEEQEERNRKQKEEQEERKRKQKEEEEQRKQRELEIIKIDKEYYQRFITNREPLPPEWLQNENSVKYKGQEYMHPTVVINSLNKKKKRRR